MCKKKLKIVERICMIIKPEKINNTLNRTLEHFAISLVTFLCAYLGILYLSAKQSRRNHNTEFLTYLLNNTWVYVSICAAIAIIANLVVFIRRINKKNICSVEFKDDSKELIINQLPIIQINLCHLSYRTLNIL